MVLSNSCVSVRFVDAFEVVFGGTIYLITHLAGTHGMTSAIDG